MGILDNIDIDINIDKDILSAIYIFQQEVEFFHVCMLTGQYLLSIYRHFFEISMNYQHLFLRISYRQNIDKNNLNISLRKF